MAKESQGLISESSLQQILNELAFKDEWINSAGTLEKLRGYLAALAVKIESDYKRGINSGFAISQNEKHVLVNSSLTDVYGRDVLLVYKIRRQRKNEIKVCFPSVLLSKANLKSFGFNLEDSKIKPIKFYDSADELLFHHDLTTFDLSEISHSLQERIDRFPDNCRGLDLVTLYNCLKRSIEHTLEMNKRDYRFILPMYNLRRNKIQWLFPFWVINSYNCCPELCLIVSSERGFAKVKTIIGVDEAYTNTRLLTNPKGSWLTW